MSDVAAGCLEEEHALVERRLQNVDAEKRNQSIETLNSRIPVEVDQPTLHAIFQNTTKI